MSGATHPSAVRVLDARGVRCPMPVIMLARLAAATPEGGTVVVDRMSVPYLNGAMIDFVDSIEKQGFTIDNPNATGSCACGDSFH